MILFIYLFGLIFLSRNSTVELFLKAAYFCNQRILLHVFANVAIKEALVCDLGISGADKADK